MTSFLFLQCWMNTKLQGKRRKKRSDNDGILSVQASCFLWLVQEPLSNHFTFHQEQKKDEWSQLATEQEKLFGSKSSPALSLRKVVGARTNGGGDAANGTPVSWLSALQSRGGRTVSQDGRRDASRPVAPVNYAAVAKEDVPRRRRHTAQVMNCAHNSLLKTRICQ